jgi:hypothetical protein
MFEKSELAVGKIKRNRVKEGVHLCRGVVAVLLRSVSVQKAGSLAEHFPEVQARADQCKEIDDDFLRFESCLT